VKTAVASLDQLIPAAGRPTDAADLEAVVTLCAVLYGEWVLVHPYANGNGRTVRVWANWAALR
jgi:fido (protein-threonine AMPylation protein)